MTRPLAVIGDPEDFCSAYISWLAGQRGVEVLVLDEGRLGIDWWFALDERSDVNQFVVDGRSMSLDTIAGAFVRLNPHPPVPPELELDPVEEAIFTRERRYGLHEFLDRVPCPVVNRPSGGRGNASKPYHMALLAQYGFAVPPWIVGNDRRVAAEFMAASGTGCVAKACSGLRSHVRMADQALLNRLDLPTTPVVLQRYVPGHDVRVHVVGEHCVATAVTSAAVDYRFDEGRASYHSTTVPSELARRCVEFTKASQLHLAGFDFRVDGDGLWWCLEANPVPTFLPYEAATAQPIGDTIVSLLVPDAGRIGDVSPLAGFAP